MATKNYRYTPPVISKEKRAHQAKLFKEYHASWSKLSTEDIGTLTAILLAYFVARLSGHNA